MKLYDMTYQCLYIYGFKMLQDKEKVKDSIQEMFLEIWKKRGSLAEVRSLQPYLFTYLKRKLYGHTKEISQTLSAEYLPDQEEMPYEKMLIENESSEIERQKLKDGFDRLTPRQKEVIRLLYYEGLTHDEIAKYTSSTKRTVYNHIYQAVEKLKKNMNVLILSSLDMILK